MQPVVTGGHARREGTHGVAHRRGRARRARPRPPVPRSRAWRAVASIRPLSRPTSQSVAPSRASSNAAAWPIPDEAPVTTTTRPVRSAGGGQCSSRDRTAKPVRLKLPTTVASSAPSTMAERRERVMPTWRGARRPLCPPWWRRTGRGGATPTAAGRAPRARRRTGPGARARAVLLHGDGVRRHHVPVRGLEDDPAGAVELEDPVVERHDPAGDPHAQPVDRPDPGRAGCQ